MSRTKRIFFGVCGVTLPFGIEKSCKTTVMLHSSTRHLVVPRNPFSDAKLWTDWKNTTVWVSKIAEKTPSMDWCKGKSTGNHGFYHQIQGFPWGFLKIFPSSNSMTPVPLQLPSSPVVRRPGSELYTECAHRVWDRLADLQLPFGYHLLVGGFSPPEKY